MYKKIGVGLLKEYRFFSKCSVTLVIEKKKKTFTVFNPWFCSTKLFLTHFSHDNSSIFYYVLLIYNYFPEIQWVCCSPQTQGSGMVPRVDKAFSYCVYISFCCQWILPVNTQLFFLPFPKSYVSKICLVIVYLIMFVSSHFKLISWFF